jgi:hypothetical protein
MEAMDGFVRQPRLARTPEARRPELEEEAREGEGEEEGRG